MTNEFSLYIHIPFCKRKCDYCDFYSEEISGMGKNARKKSSGFLNAVIKEINEKIFFFNAGSVPTAYIGGGTPSILGTNISVLFNALKKITVFKPREFTVEANPESLTEDFLSVCKEGGVTRISLGAQTFFEPSRRAVNRMGDAAVLKKALSLAKKYYPSDLSVDLITGFPFHTKERVMRDIKLILDYEPSHVSVYSLTAEQGTNLWQKIKDGAVCLPNKDMSDDLWLAAREALLNDGFLHYEVSNFAKEGKMCLHNKRYWRMKNWLGAGPSASGTVIDEINMAAKRYTVVKDLETYIKSGKSPKTEYEEISKASLIKEIILMGFRYYKGPDPKWGTEKLIPKTLNKWKNRDIMLFLNNFLINAFNELDKNI